MKPVDSGQGGQQQTDAERDGCCGDQNAQSSFTSAAERQSKSEPNHLMAPTAEVTFPSRTMTSRSA